MRGTVRLREPSRHITPWESSSCYSLRLQRTGVSAQVKCNIITAPSSVNELLLCDAARYLDLTFDAQYLLKRMHDLDQIGLISHHAIDILVGFGNFIEHA